MIKKLQDKGIFKSIVLAVVLLIPVIYSFFYLKSYWDPYGHLSDIKVGIVNLDKGLNEENRGKEFANELKNSKTFNFVDVSSLEEANKGLGEDEYYAVITIPSNFSETINSASTEHKEISTITYTPNKRKNYLASQILSSALKTVELNLESKISKEVTATLADSLKDVPNDLQKIADGAEKINDGAGSLTDGLQTLSDGVNTLDEKYSQFNDGVESAYHGSESLSDGIKKVNGGLDTLASGADTLSNATAQVYEGVQKLSKEGGSGISQLTSGISQIDNGAKSLDEGVSAYVDGTESLANGVDQYVSGTEQILGGVDSYITATESLAQGTSDYVSAMSNLNGKKTQVLQAVIQMANANPELAELAGSANQILAAENAANLSAKENALKQGADALISKNSQTNMTPGQTIKAGIGALTTADESGLSAGQKLKAGSKALTMKDENGLSVGSKLKAGAKTLYNGTTTLKNGASGLYSIAGGMQTLESALSQVDTGATKVADGLGVLKLGNEKVGAGAEDLTNGLKTLDESSDAVKEALTKLNDGSQKALEGSKELKDGTETFKTEINNGITTAKDEIKKVDGLDQYVKDPVKIEEKSYGEVDSYGVAFAPLFISIGLWVGALMCYVVLYYDQRHRFGILDHDTKKNRILQNAIYLAIGAVDGIITGLLLKVGLGYSVVNMGVYIAECMLAGLVFMSIIQFLIRNFGDIGKFIALIILVLQLAASGGTFPVETIDEGFKGFTAWLPMTYTVRAFRDTLISTDNSLLSTNTWILIGILFGIVALGSVIEIIKQNRNANKEKNKVNKAK